MQDYKKEFRLKMRGNNKALLELHKKLNNLFADYPNELSKPINVELSFKEIDTLLMAVSDSLDYELQLSKERVDSIMRNYRAKKALKKSRA